MFYLGFVVIAFFVLFLGLTVLRLPGERPAPNAELLAELMDGLDRPASRGSAGSAPLASKPEHA